MGNGICIYDYPECMSECVCGSDYCEFAEQVDDKKELCPHFKDDQWVQDEYIAYLDHCGKDDANEAAAIIKAQHL